MKNTFAFKRIAMLMLVLFSLFVMVDFLPDSEANLDEKPKSPLEGKEQEPIVDVSETPPTQDLPSLPEFDIPLDSGGCSSEGCFELNVGARASTPISDGGGSDGCDSDDSGSDAIGVFAGFSYTSEANDFQSRFDLEMKVHEDGQRTVGFVWEMRFK